MGEEDHHPLARRRRPFGEARACAPFTAVRKALTVFHRARSDAIRARSASRGGGAWRPWKSRPRAAQVRSRRTASSAGRPTASTSVGRSASRMRWSVSIVRTYRGASVEWKRKSSANHQSETPFHSRSSRTLRPSRSGRVPQAFVQAMAASSTASASWGGRETSLQRT